MKTVIWNLANIFLMLLLLFSSLSCFKVGFGVEDCVPECSGRECGNDGCGGICEPSAAYASLFDCPGYRLPTEAEWEYAARAGTVTATYNGDLDEAHLECEQPNGVLDTIAWFCGNSGDTIHLVGTKNPNSFGLYDMLGNVWEWCHDWYAAYPTEPVSDPWGPTEGTRRVVRGGPWGNFASFSRAADRVGISPSTRGVSLGFRPVRSLP